MTKEIFLLTLAFLSCLYAFILTVFLPEQGEMGAPDVSRGLRYLRSPGVIVSTNFLIINTKLTILSFYLNKQLVQLGQ